MMRLRQLSESTLYKESDIRKAFSEFDRILNFDSSHVPIYLSDALIINKNCQGLFIFNKESKSPVAIIFARTILFAKEDFLNTISHEYAHLIASMRGKRCTLSHGLKWKAVCRKLGFNPKREGHLQRYDEYIQKNGRVFVRCRNCGRLHRIKDLEFSPNRTCQFSCPECKGNLFEDTEPMIAV